MSEPARSTDVASDDLIDALKFYADDDNWKDGRPVIHVKITQPDKPEFIGFARDDGDIARAALARISRAPITDAVARAEALAEYEFNRDFAPSIFWKEAIAFADDRYHTKARTAKAREAIDYIDAAAPAHPLPQGEAGPAGTNLAKQLAIASKALAGMQAEASYQLTQLTSNHPEYAPFKRIRDAGMAALRSLTP